MDANRLNAFFAALAPMRQNSSTDKLTTANLQQLFDTLAPLRTKARQAVRPAPSATALVQAFEELKAPLARERARVGLLNPWKIAGLKRNELRNAATLAGLWSEDFGGATSRHFLASYLSRAIPEISWGEELTPGYRIRTELCPMNDRTDRVDLVVETAAHLIAIEIKIDAGLGREQLERYLVAMNGLANLTRRTPHVILLAPFSSEVPGIRSTSWQDVAIAARGAAGARGHDRDFVRQLIVRFADHIVDF
ncbi:PD-(D/E)XK nuclease family protein [Paracoccus niistensis]|uniref:PD-(D/E)XK nuclease family protein n=1 Tax=Paracoccus niistensis TaxID=632935 RepID=A0ABV6I8V6_9RHOB